MKCSEPKPLPLAAFWRCHLLETVPCYPGWVDDLSDPENSPYSSSDQLQSDIFSNICPFSSIFVSALCKWNPWGFHLPQSSFHFSEHFFLFSKLHPSMLQHQYLTLLSFKEMKFSKASSIPSQRYSLFHILKCKLRCMVRFSSLLLLPLALCQPPPIFPKPPECRKWCRGAARAGSHTMALFSSQMRSHHVTSLLPPSRGIGDTEMGLGSDSA